MPLTTSQHHTDIACGDTTVRFTKREDGRRVALQLIPSSLLDQTVAPRSRLDGIEAEVLSPLMKDIPSHKPESCVQLKIRHDNGPRAFAQGRTLCLGFATTALHFVEQTVDDLPDGGKTIRTVLEGQTSGFHYRTTLHLEWSADAPYLQAWTTCENVGETPFTLELLASFLLDHLTPFHPASAPDRLHVHRFRSSWSMEGRHECLPLEALNLERSWAGYAILSERFGQTGSMPVRGFFPFAAVEDREAGVIWGARLAHPGSWQMEILRHHDKAMLSGGLADRELGHWWKTLAPGESFSSPVATLAVTRGGVDELCDALLEAQEAAAPVFPEEERLPTIFNEWCSSWGNPTHDHLVATADRLKETKTRYLVIDDGWAERPGDDFQQNGDWKVNRTAFPGGLSATCAAIRERGLIPGLWFEFEVCNEGSEAFHQTEHHLKRDGAVLRIGTRRFWDFRDPWVVEMLSEKLIARLREDDFGYLKVDYNETLGIGVDERGEAAPGSPGEGLRQHLEGVQAFFRKIREELPDLLIENCSSGGHRLEPSMQALCAMGSFSDAHESVEIPIIAASLHRQILPRQNQVWAVLKASESLQRIRYSLSATFLGRMCISGEMATLSRTTFAAVQEAQALYEEAAPVIRRGRSRIHRQLGHSWRHPKGWQVLVREGLDGAQGQLLVVAHCFDEVTGPIKIDLPEGDWSITGHFGDLKGRIENGHLRLDAPVTYAGQVWLLRRC